MGSIIELDINTIESERLFKIRIQHTRTSSNAFVKAGEYAAKDSFLKNGNHFLLLDLLTFEVRSLGRV